LRGTIIPDLPPEEGEDFLMLMHKHHLAPIFIFTPTTAEERMRYIASLAEGFLYCVARKGVTGSRTRFSEELASYLKHCRQATDRFLAVGFGLSQRADVEYLNGKADIAVVGSQAIRIMEQEGISAVGNFIRTLH
jgi:tryptophan synthase alpha chain